MKKTIRLFLCILSSAVLILSIAGAVAAHESVLELPAEVKIIGGKPVRQQKFTIVLEAVTDGAPMPQGCNKSCALSFLGAERKNFPAISFGEPGVYHYRLYQVEGNTKRYGYDNTVYELGVYVSALPGGGLDSSVVLTEENKEGKIPDVIFTNRYYPPNGKTPKTGDAARPGMYLFLAAVSAVCLVVLLKPRKKSD